MTKVLITGGSGFIGTSLRSALSEKNEQGEEWEIVSVDRVAPKEEFQLLEQHERCDLLDRNRLTEIMRWHKPDAAIHIAAQARVDPSVTDPLGTYDLNVVASLNVLRACVDAKVPHLVAASSEAVYGKARTYPSPENNDFAPANPYAASKVALDVCYQQADIIVPTCIVRSGMGWGPRSNPREQVVGKFITKALRGEPLLFPAGNVVHPTRDLNHVSDFCEGIQRIVKQKARGVFNLSGGREYSVLDIGQRIVDAVGSGSIQYTDTFTYRPSEAEFRTWLDISKAKKVLGHEPKHHLEGKALEEVIQWYEENPNYWA